MECSAWNRSSIEFCFELRPLLFQISHNQKLRGGQRVKLQDQSLEKIPPILWVKLNAMPATDEMMVIYVASFVLKQ